MMAPAAPMITATARSTTFPLMAKSLNSLRTLCEIVLMVKEKENGLNSKGRL
jgi:hypothetical protein